MQIDDIFEIANGINNSLLMLNEKSINNRNIKKCLNDTGGRRRDLVTSCTCFP